jgi:hypothetical protein
MSEYDGKLTKYVTDVESWKKFIIGRKLTVLFTLAEPCRLKVTHENVKWSRVDPTS